MRYQVKLTDMTTEKAVTIECGEYENFALASVTANTMNAQNWRFHNERAGKLFYWVEEIK